MWVGGIRRLDATSIIILWVLYLWRMLGLLLRPLMYLIVTGKLNRAKGMVETFPGVSLKQADASHWLHLLAVRAVQLSNLNPLCLVNNSGCPVLGIPAAMMASCPTAS